MKILSYLDNIVNRKIISIMEIKLNMINFKLNDIYIYGHIKKTILEKYSIWKYSIWKYSIWKYSIWKYSIWKYSIWKYSIWKYSIWNKFIDTIK